MEQLRAMKAKKLWEKTYPPGLPSGCKAGTRRPVCLADRLFQSLEKGTYSTLPL